MKSSLHDILSRFAGKKIIVWGDIILDRYMYTSTSRVSREAPVLVTEFEGDEYRLGGAGNVVMNLLTLGAMPIPVGFLGTDAEGRKLRTLLKRRGIPIDFLVEAKTYRTPVKSRILSGGENTRKQQILRIDTIPKNEIPALACGRLVECIVSAAKNAQGLIISDYLGQAATGRIFSSLGHRLHSIPVMADSRENLTSFRGVTVATPNEPEIRKIFPDIRFLGDDDFLNAGRRLLSMMEAEDIVLKRGHLGMIALEKGKKPHVIPIFGTSQIVDVTGAGDTVLAVIALGRVSGATILDSARLANIAGGIVVMKEGATPIHTRELMDAIP